jgi:hypothetical protein
MKTNVANFIIHDLSSHNKLHENLPIDSEVISEIVEGWNQNVYVVSDTATELNRLEIKKYILM